MKSHPPVIVERFVFPKNVKTYTVPLYGGEVYFTTSRDQFSSIYDYLIGGREGQDVAEECAGCVVYGSTPEGGQGYILAVFDASLNVYTHELSHLAIAILNRAGVPIDDHTTEAFAYLIGALAEAFEWEFAEAANAQNALAEQAEQAEAEEKAAKKAEREARKAAVSAAAASSRKGGRRATTV